MNNKFGIYENSYRLMLEGLKIFPEINKAIIFGSRAMGNPKKGSDIDIAISGNKINSSIVTSLSAKLNSEYSIPYQIDVVHLEKISNKELAKHIAKFGIVFYEKERR